MTHLVFFVFSVLTMGLAGSSAVAGEAESLAASRSIRLQNTDVDSAIRGLVSESILRDANCREVADHFLQLNGFAQIGTKRQASSPHSRVSALIDRSGETKRLPLLVDRTEGLPMRLKERQVNSRMLQEIRMSSAAATDWTIRLRRTWTRGGKFLSTETDLRFAVTAGPDDTPDCSLQSLSFAVASLRPEDAWSAPVRARGASCLKTIANESPSGKVRTPAAAAGLEAMDVLVDDCKAALPLFADLKKRAAQIAQRNPRR